MKIISDIKEMQTLAIAARGEGKRISFVPTMGFLHEGHASLLHEGRKRGDLLVLSIFVNPTQFGVGEDFDKYPRDMERDTHIAAAAGVDVVFTPSPVGMYPAGYQTFVDVAELTLPLCGASRPGHFRGVTTVVCKLFNIVQPHIALFGKKDFQQLAVIRQMTVDLNMPVEVVGMPIIREQDGLAMSSRNKYLSSEERTSALCLSRSLQSVRAAYHSGERDAERLKQLVQNIILAEPSATIDYVELRADETLEKVATVDDRTLLALAVRVGATRLIDNCLLGEDD
ncbi:pantoate--beta-alanine ligase [Geobacter pelophilus]|uniref:Pantothenate synthetase n=1 Tax=Geoanaerobacter pelophilus TaxID=60036 RepID=A0AAW4L6R6_9BACT|nr:pantoate--beta-alanine ligase [Geoanaerobacter pelophilus]MBT0665867.1 pantoate--beta-alanine ligase [Geoanaerobacter pelophilus]